MANERWILDWQDRTGDPDRRVLVSADTVQEVRESIERLLAGCTWTPDNAEEIGGPDSLPAFEGFLEEVLDLTDDAQILGLWSAIKFECDEGMLLVVRER